jgi:hypothetical protein
MLFWRSKELSAMKQSRRQQWKRRVGRFFKKRRTLQGLGLNDDTPESENGPDASVRAPLKPKPHIGSSAITLPEPVVLTFDDAISRD